MNDCATNTKHDRLNQPAGKYTARDAMIEQSHTAYDRLQSCTKAGFHWTAPMILIVLQFCFYQIFFSHDHLTAASLLTATMFKIKQKSVLRLVKMYLHKIADPECTDFMPSELPQQKRGWGSPAFAAKKDDYCNIKEVHLKSVQEFITQRNQSMKGMCNINSVIAHLYSKFGIEFKYRTVHYALTTRLGLKYRTPLKSRLIFSEGRTALGVDFVQDMDHALKEQAAGRAIIVYMDETYCHLNHMPGKCWCGDAVGRVERSRSKGSLTIILHALVKDGWLACTDEDGNVPQPAEFTSGEVLNAQMVWRGKIGRGDYHDNMDGVMFEKWLLERLIPTFKAKYPGKIMYLCMDNAPYHHLHPEDSFFASGKTKEELQGKLQELGVRHVTIKPFPSGATWVEPPNPAATAAAFAGWVFFERSTGVCWLLDGLSDEGFGDAFVYTKVGNKKFGNVESSLSDDFRRLLAEDFSFIGHGEHAIRFVRSKLINPRGKVPKQKRQQSARIRRECKAFFARTATTTFRYKVCDLHQQYNGGGQKGTGGPKSEWLKAAVDAYIIANHPELRMTKVMRLFLDLGWFIIFTVPYWAKSQPIELAWAYVKGYVARHYFPGRTAKDLRRQIFEGMYGSPDGRHKGLGAELANKLILKTHKFINEFAVKQPKLVGRGLVGDLSAVGAPIPVITGPVNAGVAMGVVMGPMNL